MAEQLELRGPPQRLLAVGGRELLKPAGALLNGERFGATEQLLQARLRHFADFHRPLRQRAVPDPLHGHGFHRIDEAALA